MTRRRVRLAGLVGLVLLGLRSARHAGRGTTIRTPPRPRHVHDSVGAVARAGATDHLGPSGRGLHRRPRRHGCPAGATLGLVVHDLLESRGAFRDTLDGDLGGTEHAVAPQPLAALTLARGRPTGFIAGPGGVSLPSRGVYPVELRLRSGGETLASTVTYLTYVTPDNFPPLAVGVVVPIAARRPSSQTANRASSESSARARERIEAVEAAGATP